MLWDLDGMLMARIDISHQQIKNHLGWVEHDPLEIYRNTLQAVDLVIKKANITAGQIAVIGISNQRETAVCWDIKTGLPLYNAIVWQCNRAVDITNEINKQGLQNEVKTRTGLPLSPYFSAAKWSWMLQNASKVKETKTQGRLCFGTVDSWLLYKLTGVYKTDYSNASRTQLLNLQSCQWDSEMLEAFGIDTSCLPEIAMSDSFFGQTNLDGILPKPIPIHALMGDSHAALFGNQCWEPFSAKATYGTGSSVMMNAGTSCPTPGKGIATSVAWGIAGQVEYVLEGNINDTGAVIKWLVDDISILPDAKSAGKIASTVEDTGGVYLVPAFSGLGSPYFNDTARAAFLNMNRNTKNAHLVRAAEECIAYQIRDVVDAIQFCCGHRFSSLRVDGGPTRDSFLMQFQSDILNLQLEINQTEELSGMGVAYCAAISAGLTDKTSIFNNQKRQAILPQMDDERRKALYQGWKDAIALINTSGRQRNE